MTWGASLEMFFVLSSLGHPNIAIEPSMGTVKQLDAFRRVIHGRLARAEDAGYRGLRMHVARWVTPLVVTAARFALPAHEFS